MAILTILLTIKTMLFINITKIEHNAIIIFLFTSGISILILALIYLNNLKHKNILGLTFYSFVSLVMLIDVIHYAHFLSLPSVIMLSQASQLTDVADSVLSLITFKNLLFVMDIPLVIFYILKKEKSPKDKDYTRKVRILVPSTLLAFVLIIFTSLKASGEINSLRMQEIYTYHYNDIKNTLMKESKTTLGEASIYTEEDLLKIKDRTILEEGKHTGIGKGKNLIVLQIEALQGFVMDLVYEGQEITPNLNNLIHDKSSLYFDDYYQLLGRGNTSDAEFVTNNSLHPSMELPTYTQYENNTFYGLPWLLRDNEYNAWAFHGYKKEFWNRDAAYVNQGFQRFISEEDFEFEETIGLGITDKDFLEQSIEYLKELDNIDDNPFYAFLVTLTSHNPFDMPEEYNILNIKDEHKGTLLGNYLQSIHYLDKCIGEFVDALKDEGLYEDTIIALYGDHFAIQNYSEDINSLMGEFLGSKYDYDTIMKVPMAIHIPVTDIQETISTPGSQLDFFPTILNIMGLQNEKGLMMGRDLVNYKGYNNVKAQAMMRKGSFVDENIIFAVSRDEVFDHSTATDRRTGEFLDIHEYRHIYDETIEEINISNFILKNDIIKHLIKNNGQLDFSKIEIEDIKNREYIKKSLNTIEDLRDNYNKGQKIQTIDLEKFQEDTREDLLQWLNQYQDAYIVARTNGDKEEVFGKLKKDFPEHRDRFIAEIDDFDQHFFVVREGFKNIILNIKDKDYSDTEILDFLKVHDHFGVLMEEDRGKTSLSEEIKALGIEVYIEDEEAIKTEQ